MRLTSEQVQQFQALHLKHFGKEIDYEAAKTEAIKLITLVSIVQPKEMKIGMGNKASNYKANASHAVIGEGNGTKAPGRA